MNKEISPPTSFLRFFRWFCHPSLLNPIEGDLVELYNERVKTLGKRKADVKFTIDVLLLFRPGIIRPAKINYSLHNNGMLKSYFKIGWRNLTRNKGYSTITVGGLALGMAVAVIIGLWIQDELSFNHYHQNHASIAKVYRNELHEGEIQTSTPQVTGLGTLLRSEYSNYFKRVVMVRARTEDRVISIDDNRLTQSGYFMQPDGPEMLSLNMVSGTRNGLQDMNSILLSETLAKKLFDDRDPINEIIKMDAKWDLKVTGVYKDLPKNSEFSAATYFAPLDRYLDGWAKLDVWDNYHINIYVEINPGKDFNEISEVIKNVTLAHVRKEAVEAKQSVFLLPMDQMHLYSQFKDGVNVTSSQLKFVRLCGLIGIFVLILACINFMNLSTARSERRAREVGIKKSIGSLRSQLLLQFFTESVMVALAAFLMALVLVQIALPLFNNIGDKNMRLPWEEPQFWLACMGFVVLTGVLAGSYPAIYLSSFKPVKVLKGAFNAGRFAGLPRKVLVVVQFAVSVCLVISTIIVNQQIQFAKDRPVGYDREGLISLRPRSPEYRGKYEALRSELLNTGVVEEIAESNYPVTSTLGWNGGFSWKDKNIEPTFNNIFVTHEYGKAVGLEFVEGRDFSRDIPGDLSGSILINESASRLMGIPEPVGEMITWAPQGNFRGTYKILGVVKDMVKGSPFDETFPSIIFLSPDDQEYLYIKLKSGTVAATAIPQIRTVFNNLIPSAPFDFKFADDDYNNKFKSEEGIGKLAEIFSLLAILISCSGLFGLSSFIAEQRTKEIGIRKVLGASVLSLWRMLSKDFLILIIISCVIAIPVAIIFMNDWLNSYRYRTVVSWELVVMVVLGAVGVTILTVSFQTIKAALMNPSSSLRSE